jgi:hypothetical protein
MYSIYRLYRSVIGFGSAGNSFFEFGTFSHQNFAIREGYMVFAPALAGDSLFSHLGHVAAPEASASERDVKKPRLGTTGLFYAGEEMSD